MGYTVLQHYTYHFVWGWGLGAGSKLGFPPVVNNRCTCDRAYASLRDARQWGLLRIPRLAVQFSLLIQLLVFVPVFISLWDVGV